MKIISTTPDLERLCASLAGDAFVTVDTEFMRETTYWPILCLIQVAGAHEEAIIDPMSAGLDLGPFLDLMGRPSLLKVFHAARQDIEIFHALSGTVPTPVFDTQIAAMVCGFGEQVGYEALVRRLAGASIDKSSRFTDWSSRPLSAKQLAYALSDVTHLRTIYAKLKAELDRSGREPWLAQEMAILTAPETYRTDPAEAWRRIKFRARNKRQLAVLVALAEWREREAQERNVPRGRVLKDDAIAEIATQTPQSAEALAKLRALPRGYAQSRTGAQILAAVKAGLAIDPAALPALDDSRSGAPEGASAVADILKLALKIVCETHSIAPKLVASAADIEELAGDDEADIPALSGWRRELFGEAALAVKSGALVIGLDNGRPRLLPRAERDRAAAE